MKNYLPTSEMARIGIAVRNGTTKKDYFDFRADYYSREEYDVERGKSFWDRTVADHLKHPLKPGEYYAPISDMD